MAEIVKIIPPELPRGLDSAAHGLLGADWIDNVTDYTGGTWGLISCLADAVFTVLETNTISLNGAAPVNLNGKSLPKGALLFGYFTRIQLASGTVVAYRLKVKAT